MNSSILYITAAVLATLLTFSAMAQKGVDYTKEKITVKKIKTFDPKEVKASFHPLIQNLEAPAPGGKSYRSHLRELKKEVRKKFPLKETNEKGVVENAPTPKIVQDFQLREFFYLLDANGDTIFLTDPSGDTVLKPTVRGISGGTPLDNTLAISNDDYLMCGINTKIYMHDLKTGNNPIRSDINVINFSDFAEDEGDITTDFPFDPKIIYDPNEDRFVLTFLTGRSPSNSGLILAFSTTNNPTDPWNVYKLSGNPLDNGLWSDYPAISLSEDELFYTINLLVPGSDWKVSFSETVIWQIDKYSGYNGDDLITELWGGVALDGRNLRNLAVVHGGDKLEGPNMYFLSNRNFDIQNDTTFLVEITNKIDNAAILKITPLIAETLYGLPPNGRQANSDPNDPDDGFDTNDARVLGAYKKGNEIQFVGNSVNPNSGRAAIYHGIISDLDNKPKIKANIIASDSLDYGYPNIVFTGDDNCTNSSLIAFDHTSPTAFSGISAVKFTKDANGQESYSKRLSLKDGLDYVDQISGSYERWGDYFGLQRKYNEAGVVYSAGFYGTGEDNKSGTWFSKLRDCECFNATVNEVVSSTYNKCKGQLVVDVVNGISPVEFSWNNNISDNNFIDVNLCDYKYELTITDLHGCSYAKIDSGYAEFTARNESVYPNPSKGEINLYFELDYKANVSVNVFSIEGKEVFKVLNNVPVQKGRNLLTFSLDPLQSGSYIIRLTDGNDIIMTKRVIIQ